MITTTPKTSKKAGDQAAPSDAVATTNNNNNLPVLTIEAMVLHINTIARQNVNGGRIQIGEYLLDNIFKGNIQDASSKSPKKDNPYSKLAQSSDLELSAKDLGICLRVAVLERVLKGSDENLCGLKFSVKREIIKLPSTDTMLELARQAYGDGLTVEQTREKVQAMMPSSTPNMGKKVLTELKNHPFRMMTDDDLKRFCSDKSKLEKDLSTEDRIKIRTTAQDKLAEVKKCVAFLEGLTKTLGEIDAA